MTDITPIVEAAVSLLLTMITVLVIPLFKNYVKPWLEGKIRLDETGILQKCAETAVMAAEEAARSGKISKVLKFDYASEFILARGFTLDGDALRVVIDSAVFELINRFKK